MHVEIINGHTCSTFRIPWSVISEETGGVLLLELPVAIHNGMSGADINRLKCTIVEF